MKSYTLTKLVNGHYWSAILEAIGDEETIKFPDLEALESFRVFAYQKQGVFTLSVDRKELTVKVTRKK